MKEDEDLKEELISKLLYKLEKEENKKLKAEEEIVKKLLMKLIEQKRSVKNKQLKKIYI